MEALENKVFLDIDAARAAGIARPIPWKSAIWRVYREQAKYWLDNKGPNRKIAPSGVLRFTAEMLGDYWKTTPEGLVFDEDGKLIDGQTRLTAFVRSGLPSLDFVVYYGVDSDLIHNLNQHKPRNFKNRKQIDDALAGEPISEDFVLAIVNVVIRYGSIDPTAPKGYNIPPGMFDELVGDYLPIAQFAASLFPKNRKGKVGKKLSVNPVPAAIALANLNGVTKTDLKRFVAAYLAGEPGTPRLLHDYMLTHTSAGFNGIADTLGTTQKAIKYFLEGRDVEKIKTTRYIEYPLPKFTEGQKAAIKGAVEAMKAAEVANGDEGLAVSATAAA